MQLFYCYLVSKLINKIKLTNRLSQSYLRKKLARDESACWQIKAYACLLRDMNGYLVCFKNIQLQRNLNQPKIKTEEARCPTPEPDSVIKVIH